jgi:ATP-dependent Clp protease ATP-binding subunit ClpC
MALDETLLGEARDLRARLLELQHEADRAKLDYHHAIRRLHAAGGSMREIAAALDLSHQRVHQIVEGDEPVSTRMGWSSGPGRPPRSAERIVRKARPRRFALRRFTRVARRVVMRAQKEAHRLGAREIGPEHLLLGLVGVERGGAARALADCGVTLEGVLQELGGEPVREPSRGHLPFAQQTKEILEGALAEAFARGHGWIGSEHILLALAAPSAPPGGVGPGGRAFEVLGRLGADPAAVHAAVERVLAEAA